MSYTGKELYCKVADPAHCSGFIYKGNVGEMFCMQMKRFNKILCRRLLFIFVPVICNLTNSSWLGELYIFSEKLRGNVLCGKSLGARPVWRPCSSNTSDMLSRTTLSVTQMKLLSISVDSSSFGTEKGIVGHNIQIYQDS